MPKSRADIAAWMQAVAAAAQRLGLRAVQLRMQEIANSSLSESSAARYLAGITDVQISGEQIVYTLSEEALRLEGNSGPWDMKPGLLAAATKTTAAGTRYIDIPFKKSSPRRRKPRPFSAVPRYVDQTMRDLQAEAGGESVRAPSGEFADTAVSKLVILPDGGSSQNTSKAGYFEDIVKTEDGTPREEGDYFTIRRVSENSAHDSWIYPAREGVHMHDQLQDFIDKAAPKIVEMAMKEVVNGNQRPRRRRS